jgi:hypothetical protein
MLGYSGWMPAWIATRIGLGTAMAVLLGACASSAIAAPASAPAWKVTVTPGPTYFAPGDSSGEDRYQVTAVDVGGAPTNGEPITLDATLPAGLTLDVNGPAGTDDQGNSLSCSAGPPITCTDPAALQPGRAVGMSIPVDVAQDAGPMVTTEAVVQGGGAPSASASNTTTISETPANFGLQSSEGSLTNGDGSADTQAGSHPYSMTVRFALNDVIDPFGEGYPTIAPAGDAREVTANLPAGVVVNPEATPVRCTEAELESANECPLASQVGTIRATSGTFFHSPATDTGGNSDIGSGEPLWNMVPPAGVPAEFGFNAIGGGIYVHLLGGVRTGGDYGLTSTTGDILQKGLITAVSATLWGDPSDSSHDYQRGQCANREEGCPKSVEPTQKPFLTLPSACSGPLSGTISADSWQDSDFLPLDRFETEGPGGAPAGVTGCELLDFSPSLNVAPEPEGVAASSPSGLNVDLGVPQEESPQGLSEANLRDATVVLPAGMAISPSSANGLGACGPAEIGLHDVAAPSCPASSKVGTAEVLTPLLEEPLKGSVYLAQQGSFEGSLIGLYLAAEGSGVLIKLGGKVTLDAETGQVTATFADNPQLPFSRLKVRFFGGPRAPLATPATCGTYTTTSDLKPWSAPQSGPDATPSSSFQITSGPNGAPCVNSEAEGPNHPSFEAGTVTPLGGTYSPLVVKISREDGSQRINNFDLTLPKGLLGKLAGIPYCPEAAIAAAEAHGGVAEQQHPSCPAASQLGTVEVGLGAGSQPFHTSGKVYLAGPYKGAPISLVAITPAVAGPFDLGTVVDRVASYLAPEDVQIHSVSGTLPHILDGIPLDIRSITVDLDRPEFIVNPTNCEAMSVTGSLTSLTGSVAPLASRFQVGGCAGLPFKPKFSLRMKGGTRRHQFPSLNVAITFPPGPHANFRSAVVSLPHSEFVEQGHIRTICTRVQFAAGGGGGEQCPAASIYGHAEVQTPLLDQPLVGPVFQRSSDHKLPDLAVALRGQIDLTEDGVISSDSQQGIRSTFSVIPDANFSRFHLQMEGGKRGLIVNSENLCEKPQRANVKMIAQNGKVLIIHPLIANDCKKHAKKQKRTKEKSHSKRVGTSHR